jgi:hypothetical protein
MTKIANDQRSVTDQLLDIFGLKSEDSWLIDDLVSDMDRGQLRLMVREANGRGMYDAADWFQKFL